MIKRICIIFKRYWLSLAILAAILYLSFFKPPVMSFEKVKNIDKLAHFLMYCGFCSVLWIEYLLTHSKVVTKRLFWGAVVAPVLFSGAVEIMQEFLTEHRGGDWLDFLFNFLGVACAALFVTFIVEPLMRKYGLINRRGKKINM